MQLYLYTLADKKSEQIHSSEISGSTRYLLEIATANAVTLDGVVNTLDVTAALTADFVDNNAISYAVLAPDRNTTGLVVSTYKLSVVNSLTEQPAVVNGLQVYATITEAGGVFTLNTFTIDAAGVETATALPAGDYVFQYIAQVTKSFQLVNPGSQEFLDDDAPTGGTLVQEELIVLGAIAAGAIGDLVTLTYTVKPNTQVNYTLSGSKDRITGFTNSAGVLKADMKTIEFDASKGRADGTGVEATELVVAEYWTLDAV